MDPKHTPPPTDDGSTRAAAGPRTQRIEDWLAERLARTLGDNPDRDLDDIDEIVQLDAIDEPEAANDAPPDPPASGLPLAAAEESDAAAASARNVASVQLPASPVVWAEDASGPAGERQQTPTFSTGSADPDGFVTTPARDAHAPEAPRFHDSQAFEIVEPAPGEITSPIPPDQPPGPEVWDLLGDQSSAATVVEPDRPDEARLSIDERGPHGSDERPTVAVPWDAEADSERATVVDGAGEDEVLDEVEPEPLDSHEVPLPSAAAATEVSWEVAMPSAEDEPPNGSPARSATPMDAERAINAGTDGQDLGLRPIRPFVEMPSGFGTNMADEPATTWTSVEVADGAPEPTPPPIALAMPTPSLMATPRGAGDGPPLPTLGNGELLAPAPAAGTATPEPPPGTPAWMPAHAQTRDLETEIRGNGGPRQEDQPTLIARSDPGLKSARPLLPALDPLPEPKSDPTLRTEGRPTIQPPDLRGDTSSFSGSDRPSSGTGSSVIGSTPVRVPARPELPLRPPDITKPREARVEISPTEHGLADLGGNLQTWLAAAFGLVTALLFVWAMVALISWFNVGAGP